MAYDITRLKADLEGIGHGTTLNKITNLNGLINRAARQLLLDVDPQETKRITSLASQVFDQVYDYPLPVDVKGNKVIDIRPQVRRTPSDQFTQTYNEEFDVYKVRNQFPSMTINFNSGIKTIRLSQKLLTGVTINQINTISDNGTWAVGGDATDLTQDDINFVAAQSSLRFNLSGATGIGYIENSTMATVDLTDLLSQGTQFLWVYIPDTTNTTSINLRWGSSNADYWTGTVTTTQSGTAFETGWNLLSFNWPTSATGAPDVTAVNYLRVTYNYTIGTVINNVRANLAVSRLGSIYEIEYYSKYMFRNALTGAFQETVLTNSDLINLDTESYNLLTDCCAVLMAQQMQGEDSSFDYAFFERKYQEAVARYKALYKSEVLKPKLAYYKKTSNNFRKWFGSGPNGGGFGV